MKSFGPGGLVRALCLAALLMFAALPARAAPTFPALTGRVVDQAHVLDAQTTAQLTQQLGDLETKTSRQLIVVTLPSLQGYDIADYGYQLGRAWGVGQKGLNNGVLFVVAPAEHKVRIEVGYGLEPILTDALSNQILERAVLPRFRAGDMKGGVVAGTQALVEQLGLDTSTAEAKAAQAEQDQAAQPAAGRGGGGSPLAAIVVFIIFVLVIRAVLGGAGPWAFLPFLFMGGGGRSYGGDDRSGGGGFSGGGGGSFGGGGSSGSW